MRGRRVCASVRLLFAWSDLRVKARVKLAKYPAF